jgi:hypothetical protein
LLLLLLLLVCAAGLHLTACFLQVLILEAQRLHLNLHTKAGQALAGPAGVLNVTKHWQRSCWCRRVCTIV